MNAVPGAGEFFLVVEGDASHTAEEVEDASRRLREDLSELDGVDLGTLSVPPEAGTRTGLVDLLPVLVVGVWTAKALFGNVRKNTDNLRRGGDGLVETSKAVRQFSEDVKEASENFSVALDNFGDALRKPLQGIARRVSLWSGRHPDLRVGARFAAAGAVDLTGKDVEETTAALAAGLAESAGTPEHE